MSSVDLNARIPNNVDLKTDKKLQRALEKWLPCYQSWWGEVGPELAADKEVYLRTAVAVDKDGWAHFDYVKMPEYRWGILLADAVPDRKIGFGDHYGEPAWQEIPGEYRNMLRRIIVTQADTEPASVEQQRLLARTAPSLYDMRNLFQVNVEEGRHLWAMVYLLHGYFGRDGREEAEELLERRSGNADKPRILGAFNAPISDWVSFFMFTMFTDRDGKYQLLSLAESGFDPLSRTCRFMLTEEAHHMFVGETGVRRMVKRTCEVMKEFPDADPREHGAIDLATLQKYVNFWYSISLDLFGGEVSSNAADYFASGIKGRYREERQEDHLALEGCYVVPQLRDGKMVDVEVPLRNAMNEILRDSYVDDNQRGVDQWNKTLTQEGIDFKIELPHRRFNRQIGIYSDAEFDPKGNPLDAATWASRKDEWLPNEKDREYIDSLMKRVVEPGKIASWIAPPIRGINGNDFDFEYVRL